MRSNFTSSLILSAAMAAGFSPAKASAQDADKKPKKQKVDPAAGVELPKKEVDPAAGVELPKAEPKKKVDPAAGVALPKAEPKKEIDPGAGVELPKAEPKKTEQELLFEKLQKIETGASASFPIGLVLEDNKANKKAYNDAFVKMAFREDDASDSNTITFGTYSIFVNKAESEKPAAKAKEVFPGDAYTLISFDITPQGIKTSLRRIRSRAEYFFYKVKAKGTKDLGSELVYFKYKDKNYSPSIHGIKASEDQSGLGDNQVRVSFSSFYDAGPNNLKKPVTVVLTLSADKTKLLIKPFTEDLAKTFGLSKPEPPVNKDKQLFEKLAKLKINDTKPFKHPSLRISDAEGKEIKEPLLQLIRSSDQAEGVLSFDILSLKAKDSTEKAPGDLGYEKLSLLVSFKDGKLVLKTAAKKTPEPKFGELLTEKTPLNKKDIYIIEDSKGNRVLAKSLRISTARKDDEVTEVLRYKAFGEGIGTKALSQDLRLLKVTGKKISIVPKNGGNVLSGVIKQKDFRTNNLVLVSNKGNEVTVSFDSISKILGDVK